MKKALIADVDDTICPSTQPVSKAMAAEIERQVQSGRIFAFISGSTMPQISAQLTPFLKVPHQLLATSGTHYVTVDYVDGRPVVTEVLRHKFDPKVKAAIMDAFEKLIRRHDIRSLTTKADQLQDRDSQVTLSAIGRGAPDAAKRAFDPTAAKRKVWVQELQRELGTELSIRIGGTTSVDITPAGIDKEWGIRKFLAHNHLDQAEALFFGDNLQEGGNDFPATRVVDCVAVQDPEDCLEKLKKT